MFVAPSMNDDHMLLDCDCVPTSLMPLCLWCSMRVLKLGVGGWVGYVVAITITSVCDSGEAVWQCSYSTIIAVLADCIVLWG